MNKAIFNYPKEFVTLPEYTKRIGSIVDIIRPLTSEEADGIKQGCEQMFLIRFLDGFEAYAFESELQEVQS